MHHPANGPSGMLRGPLRDGPREGGAQSHSCREGLCASETERQRHRDKENEQIETVGENRQRELKAPCPGLLHGHRCRGWRVLRAHQGLPRVDVGRGWAPGLWILDRQELGGSGVLCTGGQGWASSPAPAALPSPCLPGANTGTFMASQKGPWGSQSGF